MMMINSSIIGQEHTLHSHKKSQNRTEIFIMSAIQCNQKRSRMESNTSDNCSKRAKKMAKENCETQDFISSITKSKSVVPGSDLRDFFHNYTDKEIEAYQANVTSAIRSRDIERVQRLNSEGQIFQCSNRFGESIMHMACRQGCFEIVKFLVEDAKVTIRLRDDYGRTPLHDAFWSVKPNFDIVNLLLGKCPSLLFVCDKRGHTPLQYARVEHTLSWAEFLKERQTLIQQGIDELKQIKRQYL